MSVVKPGVDVRINLSFEFSEFFYICYTYIDAFML